MKTTNGKTVKTHKYASSTLTLPPQENISEAHRQPDALKVGVELGKLLYL